MLNVLVLVVLILLNAFFAASEIALISLNDNKVKAQAEEGDQHAKRLLKLLQEPSRFLATIQIGITLAGFLASAFAADRFSEAIAGLAYRLGVPLPFATLDAIAVVLITVFLSYFTLVFGELVPKRLAMQRTERVSRMAVRPLLLLSKLTMPFVHLLTWSTNVTVRLFGVDPNEEDEEVTEEEIRMMVDVGLERGTIQESEQRMIDNIFEFDNKDASDIMTHRTHIVAIPHTATLNEVIETINETQFTRYPVYKGSLDEIVGILHVKEMMPFLNHCDEASFQLTNLLRKPFHVPISRKTDELFRDMQKAKEHMAVVVDEYGGTAGIVTIEDLLEEIVGNIFDEYDDEEDQEVVRLEDGTYLIDGTVSLDEVEELLEIDLPVDEYDTLSGFIIGQVGRFPGKDEHPEVTYGGAKFVAEEVGRRCINKVRVMVPKEQSQPF